jgi:hypothetical protein
MATKSLAVFHTEGKSRSSACAESCTPRSWYLRIASTALIVLMALLVSLPLWSQTTVTGTQVSDVESERALFLYLGASSASNASQSARVKRVVSNAADAAVVIQYVNDFNTQYQVMSATYNSLPVSTVSRACFKNRFGLTSGTYV